MRYDDQELFDMKPTVFDRFKPLTQLSAESNTILPTKEGDKLTKEEYTKEFITLLDIYKDSNMALNKNLVQLTTKYISSLEAENEKMHTVSVELFKSRTACLKHIEELEEPKTCDGCKYYDNRNYEEKCTIGGSCTRWWEDDYEPKVQE